MNVCSSIPHRVKRATMLIDPLMTVMLLTLLHNRFIQETEAVDGSGCDSRSTSAVLPVWQLDSYKRKTFVGCTLRSGELAVTTNRMNVPIDVTCRRVDKKPGQSASENTVGGSEAREQLSAQGVLPNHAFLINVYLDVESIFGPRWDCYVRRSDLSYNESLHYSAFSDFKRRESFSYEVTRSGLYEKDPRLVERWKLPKSIE